MNDLDERLSAIEERLNALESKAAVGGSYFETGGSEVTLQDTFRYVENIARVLNGIYSAMDQSALSASDREDLQRRFAEYDAMVSALHRS